MISAVQNISCRSSLFCALRCTCDAHAAIIVGRAQAGCLLLQRLFSNAMVTKMVQKRMQGKAGLGTKMVLPCKRMQVLPLRPAIA